MSNKYELDDAEVADILIAEKVNIVDAIDDILKEAVRKISIVRKKYPDLGIGDTATDESIASEFYDYLHYMS